GPGARGRARRADRGGGGSPAPRGVPCGRGAAEPAQPADAALRTAFGAPGRGSRTACREACLERHAAVVDARVTVLSPGAGPRPPTTAAAEPPVRSRTAR